MAHPVLEAYRTKIGAETTPLGVDAPPGAPAPLRAHLGPIFGGLPPPPLLWWFYRGWMGSTYLGHRFEVNLVPSMGDEAFF